MVQRLRFRYRVTPAGAGLGHRDIANAWLAALEGAGFAVARSQGKRPAPRVSLAAPLPQDTTSDGELADVYLDEPAPPSCVLQAVSTRLPPGLEAVAVEEVGPSAPSLQSQVRWAEYEADVPAAGLSREQVKAAIDAFLGRDSVPMEHQRENKVRRYDIRPLVLDIRRVSGAEGCHRLLLRLRAEQDMTARADQTLLALGLPAPVRVHRLRLQLDEIPAVISAFRRQGEPEDVG
jgi:radical SAM-linked protein